MGEKGDFNKRLQSLRKKSGLSVADTARAIGVPVSTYREWEYGRKIKGEPYVLLAQTFEVSLSELLTGKKAEIHQVTEYIEQIEKIIKEIKSKLGEIG